MKCKRYSGLEAHSFFCIVNCVDCIASVMASLHDSAEARAFEVLKCSTKTIVWQLIRRQCGAAGSIERKSVIAYRVSHIIVALFVWPVENY